jgi:hypothetical protein
LAPLIPFIPLIAAGIGAAATGVAIAEQPGAPKAPANTGQQQAAAQLDAAQTQAAALTKRRGMASTVLTSPLGAGPAQTKGATLGA